MKSFYYKKYLFFLRQLAISRLNLENLLKNGCAFVCFTHTKSSESALYTSKGDTTLFKIC